MLYEKSSELKFLIVELKQENNQDGVVLNTLDNFWKGF